MNWNISKKYGNDSPISSLGARISLSTLMQTLVVAEHLNFRHAAGSLNVSQSSISTRVKALEEELGVELFERHARGVRLTDAGRHFVEQVAIGINQLDRAVKTANETARGEYGRLRMGVYALIPESFLVELLGRFREAYPCIAVEIVEGTAKDAVTRLREGRLDITFVAGTPKLSDCHSRPIWSEPHVFALPAAHDLANKPAIDWSDLRQETFLVCQGGAGPQVEDHIVLSLAEHGPTPAILRFDIGHGALLSMVGQGFGITVVGASSSLLPISGVTFAPIAGEAEAISYSAVWSPFNRSPALRNLLTLASQMGRSVRLAGQSQV